MEKLTILTQEQQDLIPIVRQHYLDLFYKNQEIDKDAVKNGIKWLYSFCNKEEPDIFFMNSPLGCQVLYQFLTNNDNNIWANIGANIGDNIRANIWANIRDNIGANLRANLGANIRANIGTNIRDNIGANIRDNIRDNIGDNIRANIGDNIGANIRDNYQRPCYYINISDYGWIAFYKYLKSLNHFTEYNWNNFDKIDQLLHSGIYEIYTFKKLCIVCAKPKTKQDSQNRLHSENDAAVKFKDGFEMYYWHGINVPSKWIIDSQSITTVDILNEKNVEKRRCLQEILGSEKYLAVLGAQKIDKDIDVYGNPICLYMTSVPDETIHDHLFFLKVICPSTKREYTLCVPEYKNVWDAKAWTFKNQKIEIRHGDVGLLNLSKEFNQPIFES